VATARLVGQAQFSELPHTFLRSQDFDSLWLCSPACTYEQGQD